jgi:hypothetical protein
MKLTFRNKELSRALSEPIRVRQCVEATNLVVTFGVSPKWPFSARNELTRSRATHGLGQDILSHIWDAQPTFEVAYLTMLLVSKLHIINHRMINECGTVLEMRIGRGKRSTRRKPAPVPLWPLKFLRSNPGHGGGNISNCVTDFSMRTVAPCSLIGGYQRFEGT